MKSKKISLIVLTAIMLFSLALMPASAEVTELWSRSKGFQMYDGAYGVATDASDNVIVTGEGSQYSADDRKYHTIKYDKDGNELWIRSYGPVVYGGSDNRARGVATDASENVIVTGYSIVYGGVGGKNYYTIKYDKNGNELWNRSYNSGGLYDEAYGVATDASENVIVTGRSYDGSTWNYCTIKYDKTGTVLWIRGYDGGYEDRAYGVATDASESVIVTGYSHNGSRGNYYTVKYDKDGTVVWSSIYNGGDKINGGYGDYSAYGVATDASENVIVTGSHCSSGFANYTTIKYNKDGAVVWIREYDGGYPDYVKGVAADASENVIVTGISYDGSDRNFYTIKYDKDGTVLWSRSCGSEYGRAGGHGVATDAAGNVIVTGYSLISNINNYDFYTIKYGRMPVVPATGGDPVYFGSSSGAINDLTAIPGDAHGTPPVGVNLEYALFSFNVTGITPGDNVTITLTFPENLPADTEYWKYGKTADNPTDHWYEITVGDNDGDNVITITLRDGGMGDDDLTANGVIVDDGGPSLPSGAVPYVVSSDDTGKERNTFELSEDVYCYAGNLPAGDVDIYVVANQGVWNDNDTLTDVSGVYETRTTESSDGNIANTKIWSATLTQGDYDIVVDTNQNGEWNTGEPIDSEVDVGFTAVPEFTTIAIPVAAVLGLVFLMSRRSRQSKRRN
jgi:hypothetical protein